MKNLGLKGARGRSNWILAAAALALLAGAVLVGRPVPHSYSTASATPLKSPSLAAREVAASYGKLPIAFEENRGQSDSQVKFLAHGSDSMLFLTAEGAVLRLKSPAKSQAVSLDRNAEKKSSALESKSAVVRLTLAGSNPHARVAGLDRQPGRSNYIIGRDRSRWQTNVPQFARVKYSAVYLGVDVIYYGHDGLLESDFVLTPGADAKQINLRIAGARKLTPDAVGNLVLSTSAGDVVLARPVAYQEIAGIRQPVAARYALRGSRTAGIELGPYDRAQQLVIDPVIGYSTLLGGSAGETGNGIAVDANGDAYICGSTSSSDFPATAGVYQGTQKSLSSTNSFVAELNPTGTGLIFATYFGGSGSETAYGIGLDAGSNVYIAGTTTSFDLPTVATSGSPILSQFPSGNLGTTGFFAELSSAGTVLSYSTYLGGNTRDTPSGLFVDSSGNAYVVGTTSSTNFPISTIYSNAFQTFSNSTANGGSAAFLSKISTSANLPGLQALLYSTYLGGSDSDGASAVAADAQGNAYITGTAASTDFPITPGAFQSSISAGTDDAFVTRIDTTQAGDSSLIYSSYLGGSGTSGGEGNAIAADSNFNAYVGGGTAAADFPVSANAFIKNQPFAGYIMAFVARFNTNNSGSSSLVYSTYLGGSNVSGNYVYGIAADQFGDAYATGSTYTNNYPITSGVPQAVQNGISNSILTVLNPAGTGLIFSTYWGGTNNDQGNAIALDTSATPNAYVAGTAKSANFPTTSGAYQSQLKGLSDAFIFKMSPGAAQGVFVSPTTLAFGNQGVNSTSQAQNVTLSNNVNAALDNIAITFTGTNAGDFGQTNTCGETSTTDGSLTAFQSCTISVTFTPTVSGAESATMNVADSATGSPQLVTLSGTGTAISLSPSALNFGSQAENTTSPAQTVTLTNNGTTALTINNISTTGTNAGDFGLTNTCPASPATLAGGANCTISVTFTPTTQAAESATLQVADSDPSSPQTVALSGTGTKPASGVSVSPTSLSFGNQSQGTASPSQPVTLTNTGTAALTISSIATTGTNPADFSQTNTCPSSGSTLAAGTSCTINVTFTPSTQAAESASLTIMDSDPTSPQSVPLTGTGTAPVTAFAVTVNPTAAALSAGQSIAFNATVTSENSFNSPVTFVFSGCPGDSSCTASPNPVTPPANGSTSSTITIQTNLQPTSSGSTFHHPAISGHPLWLWTLLVLGCALSSFWAVRRRGVKRFACAFAMVLLIGLANCSGAPSTPKGTYKITVQGTSGGQSFPVTFTLTVN
jgi:hypothetical protein